MADENAPKPTPPVYTIESTRNDVTLGATEIIPFLRLKGKKANTFYPAIQLTLDNKDKIFKWIGDANLINIIQKSLKAFGQAIAPDCINKETGVFDQTLFAKYLTDFTSTGMKLSDIENEIDELQALATTLIDQGAITIAGVTYGMFALDENGTPIMENNRPKLSDYFQKLNDDIRSYRQMRDDKQRKPKEEEEDTVASVAS